MSSRRYNPPPGWKPIETVSGYSGEHDPTSYADHLGRVYNCGCTDEAPAQKCDVGTALWWIRKKRAEGK